MKKKKTKRIIMGWYRCPICDAALRRVTTFDKLGRRKPVMSTCTETDQRVRLVLGKDD